MSNITNINTDYIPAPERDRKNHVPAVGDIYYDKGTGWSCIIRITSVEKKKGWTSYGCMRYNILKGGWEDNNNIADDTLRNYYRLLIGDLEEMLSAAKKAVAGDYSDIRAMLSEADTAPETMALIQSKPAEQIFALTEAGERLQDKVTTIKHFMDMTISQMRKEMEERVRALDEKLDGIKAYVVNLQRLITVMNLYTGKNVDIAVVADGTPAAPEVPIHVRQRILFMDEEYLADAENGGIDYTDIGRFCEWLKEPRNRDIICPEEKCIVAMKPKRYNGNYSRDYYTNEILNRWNHHTIVVFRDGERILMIDSEDLELYGTAIPYTDLIARLEKKHIGKEKFGSEESQMKLLNNEAESLGYMYTKYLSFLQGLVDSGQIFSLEAGRPNFAKEEGVKYVYDDENVICTGRQWHTFQKEVNSYIRRGTRILFCPSVQDEYGRSNSSGEPSRFYMYEDNIPPAPATGVYNVDYPTKTERERNPETGRWETVTRKGDKLAIFYTPEKRWHWRDSKIRNESWIYNPDCVINYDMLSVKVIDEYMADRNIRSSFRSWMPILQQVRKELIKEKESEDVFISSMENELLKEMYPDRLPAEIARDTRDKILYSVREAVNWWKNKVIFTRPLTKDDAKAWRMIKKEVTRKIKKEWDG